MNILLLVEQPGPAEGVLTSNLRAEGHQVFIYDVRGGWIKGEKSLPLWLKGYRLRYSGLAASYFRDFIQRKHIEKVITSGIISAAFAAQNISLPFTPLLFRGDLDFSAAKTEQTDAFTKANQGVSRFLLEDEWEMDKANAKGSSVPHLLMPPPPQHHVRVLDRNVGQPRVAILHPARMPKARLDLMIDNFADGVNGIAVTPLEVESLYRTADLARARDIQGLVASRLSKYSHVVLIGTSRHHSSVLNLLIADWDRLAMEDTIGGGNLAHSIGFTRIGRGLKLVEIVAQMMNQEAALSAKADSPHPEETSDSRIGHLERLDQVMARPVGAAYEELAALKESGPLNIFFSVAPLQDVTNGARPQRIRNMAEAIDSQSAAVRLFSSGNGFNRRAILIRQAIENGRTAGFFYGENSTAPIADDQVIAALGNFLTEFREAGGKSGWFVRDLHWLEEVDGYLDDASAREETVRRGILELETVARRADVVFAPNEESGDGFNELLSRGNFAEFTWEALPPGVCDANASSPASFAKGSDGFTLLYAGGTNSVYGMNTYLSALRDHSAEDTYFDFVCREAEVEDLRAALLDTDLIDDPRVRILHVELENYLPRTPVVVGTILLDSDYAKFSFPYKTVSMIERGFPILTYSDMAIARFVSEFKVGVAVERNAASIGAGIDFIRDHVSDFDFDDARRQNSWTSRVSTVKKVLGANTLQDA